MTIRADYGKYADDFKKGGYVAIGWMPESDLTGIDTEQIRSEYEKAYPDVLKPTVIGNHSGQIRRFLELQAGDIVLTPTADSDFVNYGTVLDEPYFYVAGGDTCPYTHRRRVQWNEEPLRRSDFSVPLQNTMRSLLTVFEVSQIGEILTLIGKAELVPVKAQKVQDVYEIVLERILSFDAYTFEQLVTQLLVAMGFEETQHTGQSGDGGVDARGTLNVGGLARIKLFVQAKRYNVGAKINAKAIRDFRGSVPSNAQGAFITTSDFAKGCYDVANEQGFPRIGLINGRQLVDLLTLHWENMPDEMKEQLGLRLGLVVA